MILGILVAVLCLAQYALGWVSTVNTKSVFFPLFPPSLSSTHEVPKSETPTETVSYPCIISGEKGDISVTASLPSGSEWRVPEIFQVSDGSTLKFSIRGSMTRSSSFVKSSISESPDIFTIVLGKNAGRTDNHNFDSLYSAFVPKGESQEVAWAPFGEDLCGRGILFCVHCNNLVGIRLDQFRMLDV